MSATPTTAPSAARCQAMPSPSPRPAPEIRIGWPAKRTLHAEQLGSVLAVHIFVQTVYLAVRDAEDPGVVVLVQLAVHGLAGGIGFHADRIAVAEQVRDGNLGIARFEQAPDRRKEQVDDVHADMLACAGNPPHLGMPDGLVMEVAAQGVEIARRPRFEEVEHELLVGVLGLDSHISPRASSLGAAMLGGITSRAAASAARLVLLGVDLCKSLVGEAEAVDRCRDAAVDADLEQDLADFLAREAVVERAADVDLEFVAAVEHRDHRQVDQAPVTPRQAFAAPVPAPAVSRDELLQWVVERAGLRQRAVDISIAEHLAADFHSLVVEVLVHWWFLQTLTSSFPRKREPSEQEDAREALSRLDPALSRR